MLCLAVRSACGTLTFIMPSETALAGLYVCVMDPSQRCGTGMIWMRHWGTALASMLHTAPASSLPADHERESGASCSPPCSWARPCETRPIPARHVCRGRVDRLQAPDACLPLLPATGGIFLDVKQCCSGQAKMHGPLLTCSRLCGRWSACCRVDTAPADPPPRSLSAQGTHPSSGLDACPDPALAVGEVAVGGGQSASRAGASPRLAAGVQPQPRGLHSEHGSHPGA